MINILILIFLLIFIVLFILDRYYFYKIFYNKIDKENRAVLIGQASTSYKPVDFLPNE